MVEQQTKSEKPEAKLNKMTEKHRSLADLLKNVPSNDAVAVELPSKNRFYNLDRGWKACYLAPHDL